MTHCLFTQLPLEVQFLIYDFIKCSDYGPCLRVFRTFSGYVQGKSDHFLCRCCKNVLSLEGPSRRYKFCVTCQRPLCNECISLHRYSSFLIDARGDYRCITATESCHPEWWKTHFRCPPHTHTGVFCTKFGSESCTALLIHSESPIKLHNEDILTCKRQLSMGVCKINAYTYGKKKSFWKEGEEWVLPDVHNVHVYECETYRQVSEKTLIKIEDHLPGCSMDCKVVRSRPMFYSHFENQYHL